MSEVGQPSRESSVDSSQLSTIRPVPAINALADYMHLIPPHAPTYSGEAGITPFQELEAQTVGWMRSLRISEEYQVELAQTLLRGAALYCWHDRENRVGQKRG